MYVREKHWLPSVSAAQRIFLLLLPRYDSATLTLSNWRYENSDGNVDFYSKNIFNGDQGA